ncbi:MAG: M20/M25/M40 family metallo-hydrolase, partial [Bacteroidia bacterium]|nr:M20/M25/M40 family metallo-hydrolase [Bacteroidia bacterium]
MSPMTTEAIELLRSMIRITSFSKEEDAVADLIESFLSKKGLKPQRVKNNIFVRSASWDDNNPTCLLNSHIDTVKPSQSYTYDPFGAVVEEDKLVGLGSNDAGASVVSLITTFLQLHQAGLPFNLILLISAEEEISGKNGVELVLPMLDRLDFGIVGEPTNKQICRAEKGLMVLDGKALGESGHAARDVG